VHSLLLSTGSYTTVARVTVLALLAIAALTPWQPAHAQIDTKSFELWTPVYADFPIINSRIRGYLEDNPRFRDDPANINQNLLRTALGYRIRDNIEFFQGYAWIQAWIPRYIQEQRVYQQLGIGHVLFNKIQVLHRFRTEQRFIQRRNGCAVRLRYMLRLARPIALFGPTITRRAAGSSRTT